MDVGKALPTRQNPYASRIEAKESIIVDYKDDIDSEVTAVIDAGENADEIDSANADATTAITSEAEGDAMVQRLYHELRRLAAAKLKNLPPGQQSLQPTELVHEVYLRLVKDRDQRWKGRRHFYRAAAIAMRHVLIGRARSKLTDKRGGQWRRTDISISLADPSNPVVLSYEDLLTLDKALNKLQREFPNLAELVLLRYFCGLTVVEIAKLLGKTTRTVERNWSFARAWLLSEIDNRASLNHPHNVA